MITGEAEVVGEYMAIEFFSELRADDATSDASSKSSENGPRD